MSARQRELQAEQGRIGGLVEGKAKPYKRVKYWEGDDTWSGAGSQPKWVRDQLAGGGTLDQLKGLTVRETD